MSPAGGVDGNGTAHRAPPAVRVTIDGRGVEVPAGTTIWEAARRSGIEIPVLCHDPRLRPIGVCRVCLVDVGEKRFTAACVREVEPGMEVRTTGEKLGACRRGLVELLLADYPVDGHERLKTGRDLLAELALEYDIPFPTGRSAAPAHAGDGRGTADAGRAGSGNGRGDGRGRTRAVAGLPPGGGRPADTSSPVIHVDHQACILCDRCIRACDEVQVNLVIGRTGKGYGTRISFDLDRPMGDSTCVACGECEKVCPTRALTLQHLFEPGEAESTADQNGWEYV